MGWLITTLRRALLLALLGGAAGAVWVWWRDRQDGSDPRQPPQWPPMTTPGTTTGSTSETTAPTAAATTVPTAAATTAPTATASPVNALVDAPDARSDRSSNAWVDPLPDGSCPPTHPVKANDNSGIYHLPGGRFYARTKAERCYVDAAAAAADGYREAKA